MELICFPQAPKGKKYSDCLYQGQIEVRIHGRFCPSLFQETSSLQDKINVISPEIHVIKRNNIASIINQISVTYGEKITQIEINSMYDELYPHTQVGQEIRDKHVQNIESRTNSDSESYSVKEDIGEKQICPLCGKELVLRITKRGVNAGKEFYGCKGYPQCRYIKK